MKRREVDEGRGGHKKRLKEGETPEMLFGGESRISGESQESESITSEVLP